MNNKSVFLNGAAAGIPIGLGYFAVAFSLGIVARRAGLSPFQGFISSFLNRASAGEYALYTAAEQLATYIEVALIIFVVNARYMLMSCALSQRISENTAFAHRFLVAFGITDEIFGISIAQKGFLNPFYTYGALMVAAPLWSAGTACGIIAGNILPVSVVNALSVALYGMFLAIIIPPAKKNMTIASGVVVSFALSWAFSVLPFVKNLSGGNRTIILTVVISAVIAYLKPVKTEE